MALKISDLLGLSPSRELTTPTGGEIAIVSVPQGTSPETYVSYAVTLQDIADLGGGGGASSLDGLSDVDLTTTAPAEGDILVYDTSVSPAQWVPYRSRFSTKTANYTLALTDRNSVVYFTLAGVSPLADLTCTIPTNAAVAFPVGTLINVGFRSNGGASPANTLTIVGDTGVTVNGTSAGSVVLSTSYTGHALQKIAADEWVIW